jgi:hypothetical protein
MCGKTNFTSPAQGAEPTGTQKKVNSSLYMVNLMTNTWTARSVFCAFLLAAMPATGRAANCAPLQIQRGPGAGQVILSWATPGCRLQTAIDPRGPWSEMGPVTSPYLPTPNIDVQRFFRVISDTEPACVPNVVGYVNQVLIHGPANNRHLVANPFNLGNNDLNALLPLPDALAGTIIERWHVATQRFTTNTFLGGANGGWSPPALVDPGEGFFLRPAGTANLQLTWIGQVPEGTLVQALPAPGQIAYLAARVPIAAPIGYPGAGGTLQFPAEDGDVLDLFNSASQSFESFFYFSDGSHWGFPSELGPTIPLATGFVVNRDPSATGTAWTTILNVSGGCTGCAPVYLSVRYLSDSNEVELSWADPGYQLQTAELSATNDWTDLPGSSPMILPVTPAEGVSRLFRLKCD